MLHVLAFCFSVLAAHHHGMAWLATEQWARDGEDQQDVLGGYGISHGDRAVRWVFPRQVGKILLRVSRLANCSPKYTRQRQ